MERCPFCSAECRPGDAFCLNCGTRLSAPSPVKKKRDIAVTNEAGKAHEYAVEEAVNFRHRIMRVEHFLAGLVREEEERGGGVAELLERTSVETAKVREAITFIFGYGQQIVSKQDMQSSPRIEKMLDKAEVEAKRLKHSKIDTVHILKVIVSESNSTTISIFDLLDVNLEHLQERVDLLLEQIPPSETTVESDDYRSPLADSFIL